MATFQSMPTPEQFALLKEMTQIFVDSGFYQVADGKEPYQDYKGNTRYRTKFVPIPYAQAMGKVIKGWGLGITDPASSLDGVIIIQGKLTLSAALTGALMKAHGYEWQFIEKSPEVVSAWVWHNGKLKGEIPFSYTRKQADLAGHTEGPNKENWNKFPEEMLVARFLTMLARSVAPEVFVGSIYTPDELGAEMDGDGNIIEYATPPAYTSPQPKFATFHEPAKAEEPAVVPEPPKERTEADEIIDRIREHVKVIDKNERVAWVVDVCVKLAEETDKDASEAKAIKKSPEMLKYLASLDVSTLLLIEKRIIDSFQPAKPTTEAKEEKPLPTAEDLEKWNLANEAWNFHMTLCKDNEAQALDILSAYLPEGVEATTREAMLQELAKLPTDSLVELAIE